MTDTAQTESAEPRRSARPWLCAAGVAVAAFGGFALWKAFDIAQPTAYRPMGPRVFPVIISSALIVLGLLLVAETVRGADPAVEEHVATELRSTDGITVLLIVAALAGYTALFNRLGYVVATTLFLPTAARLLGSRRPLRDVVVGAAVAIAAFVVFTELLSIELPDGVLGDVV